MGKNTGFMEYPREHATRARSSERVNDWFEIYQDFAQEKLRAQGGAMYGLRRPVLSHRLSS